MSGTVTLDQQSGNVETSRKVKIESRDDVDAIRGISATKASLVFVDLKTKDDFDLAIESLKIARECVPQ
jgi:hypothetical protein